ncbi:MFS transporter [uncultured Roseibium sp.]|uniref:MFS transporter n=1 Tax=uncultured Roseibium sp. TaxID=1936171 RepID=UPI003217F728
MPRVTSLFVLSLAASLLMIGVGMIVAIMPERVYAASGNLQSVSLIASVFAVSYLLAQLPAGILSDRFGARVFLVLGYGVCGLSGLVFFFSPSADGILFGRLIQGIGEAPIWALGPALLSRAYAQSKGRAIGLYNAAIHAGLTLGPLAGLAIGASGDSNLPFLIFAALCFAGGLAIFLLLPEETRHAEPALSGKADPRALLRVMTEGRHAVLFSGVLLYGACYGIFVSVLPISLTLLNGFGGQETGILFFLFYAAISLSQVVAGPLSDRHGRRGFLIGGMALAALGFGTVFFVPGLWALGPLFLASLGLGAFCVASIADLSEAVQPDLRGTVSGGYYLFWAIGYFAGPQVIGLFGAGAQETGYAVLGLVLAGQTLAMLFFLGARKQT